MRGLYTTLALFLILIICGTLNFFYIRRVHEDMHQMVDQISSDPSPENEERLDALLKYWEKVDNLVSISVSFYTIEDVSLLISAAKVYNQENDATQLHYTIEQLKMAIDNIKRLETFSIKNIL